MLVLFLLLGAAQAFLMTKVEPGQILVSPGQTVQLLCATDDHYEYCKWISPQNEKCDFEWKRAVKNITMQSCDFPNRVTFHAKYDDRECGITFTAREQDQGVWKCEMEDYVFGGSRGSGDLETGEMRVTVQAPTPPPTTTSTISTPDPRYMPDELRTTERTTVRTTTTTTVTSTTTTTTTTVTDGTSTTTTATTTSSLSTPGPVPRSSPEYPEAEPSTQQTGGSSAGVVGGILLALIIIVTAVFGVFYYRRRKARIPVVGYATADNTVMVPGSNPVTIHNSSENTNFHEYFPPNLTYSTSTPQSDA